MRLSTASLVGVLAGIAVATGMISADTSSGTDAPPIEVVRKETWRSPAACRVLGVASRLRSFGLAVTHRQVAQAVDSFATGRKYQWYSMTTNREGELEAPRSRHVSIRKRRNLRPYFERRSAHAERIRLIAVQVQFYERRKQRVGFELVARRDADDLAAQGVTSHIAQGKGEVDCLSGRLAALSLGMAYGGSVHGYCGWSPQAEVPSTVLACSRRTRRR